MGADLLSVLKEHARIFGDVVAVEAAGRSLDYQTLDKRSDLVASALRAIGLQPGSRVAILAKSCVEYFEFLIGALKAGTVSVPVNWRLAAPEIECVLEDSAAQLLVVEGEFIGKIEAIKTTLLHSPRVISLDYHPRFPLWADWLDGRADEAAEVVPIDFDGGTIVLQIYTSGTTGRPKGVMTSSAAFTSYLASLSDVAQLKKRSISLSTLPLFHIGGTGWALAGIFSGATVLLLAAPGRIPAESEIIGFCKERIASYKCPTSVEFVDTLPRTPSGKVEKYRLKERYGETSTTRQ